MTLPVETQSPETDPKSVARAIVLSKLTHAPRTRSELFKDLKKKNVPEEIAIEVLDRFTEIGLINDELFASMWTGSRHTYKGLAPRAIAYELQQKGIDRSLIDEAVSFITAEQELIAARKIAIRKLKSCVDQSPEATLRKIVSALARKGYGANIAFQVAKEVTRLDPELSIEEQLNPEPLTDLN